nr:MAG TPA: hypothetical protein [Caudoviricetes sp.]
MPPGSRRERLAAAHHHFGGRAGVCHPQRLSGGAGRLPGAERL